MCVCVCTPFDFQDVSSCNTAPVEGAESGDVSLVYLCSAQSREDGTFSFPSLASGDYTVVRSRHTQQTLDTAHYFSINLIAISSEIERVHQEPA